MPSDSPEPADLAEFAANLETIDTLSMKIKRQLYNAMRNDASMHTLIPRTGMTLAQICTGLVLRDKV